MLVFTSIVQFDAPFLQFFEAVTKQYCAVLVLKFMWNFKVSVSSKCD